MANNIKSQLFSGVFYTALAKYSGVVISLVVAGILARLLSPDDFGCCHRHHRLLQSSHRHGSVSRHRAAQIAD